ncbi:MAG TPA: RpiR family transcriptional regulator, partial [Patescibacteria group bacterium]|nr:RpiR family transcriptional regulator [Patescibacteria group bacterium]
MINIDFSKLNQLEHKIYNRLLECSKLHSDLKITQAADLCSCSVSKISKFVKKLGFTNYKQFMDFLYGKEISQKKTSSELERIKLFIDDFDASLVEEFIELMNNHEKIILFGYGPSFICAQYFEYRLRVCSSKFILAVGDEISLETM